MRKMGLGLLTLIIATLGCEPANRRPIGTTSFSPSDAASAAFKELDKNSDNVLDEKELAACPSLQSAVAGLDSNGDRKIAKDELEARLQSFKTSNVGIMSWQCSVRLAGQPLGDADVTLVPESWMGSSFKEFKGKTQADGSVSLRGEGYDVDGVAPGYYRVKISKMVNGQESIPAKYNSATTLGAEVSPVGRSLGAFQLTR